MPTFLFSSAVFRMYPYIVWTSLLLTISAAYFSVGNHHPDEHFQILEFANAKIGLSDTKELPWEYEQLARSTIQPFMAIYAMKLMHAIGIDNPFSIAFLIRLITGICTWAISILMINVFIGDFKTKGGKLFFMLSVLLLWFVPYLNVRFSSENLSGYSFLLALLLLLIHLKSVHKKGVLLMASGLLFGFSFYFRFKWLLLY